MRFVINLILLTSLTLLPVQAQSVREPDVQNLFQQLQDPATTSAAAAQLVRIARRNGPARDYIAAHLPVLLQGLPASVPSSTQTAMHADVAENVVRLAGDLKLKEAVPALVSLLPKLEQGGQVTFTTTERLKN